MCTGLEMGIITAVTGAASAKSSHDLFVEQEKIKKKAEREAKQLQEKERIEAEKKQKMRSDQLRLQLAPTTSSINPTGATGVTGATTLTGSVLG